jgi:hypothetical protein
MPIPDNWKDFVKEYSFKDIREVYTNGSRLIPTFRVEQMMEHYHHEWISVKDRLPEKSVPVLICANGHRVTAYYDKVKKVFRLTEDEDLYYLANYVTHWMPLPDPPKPKDNISREESDEQLYGGYEEDRKTMIGSNE